MELRVSVLGPLRVERNGTGVRLGPQLATLLSVLLLETGRSVPAGRLVDLLWGEAAPDGAAATLRSHVSHLRRALAPDRSSDDRIVSTVGTGAGTGYRLDLAADQVDARRFEAGYAEGQRLLSAGEATHSVAVIGAALALWRGPAFADVAGRPFAVPEVARLDALRRAARRRRAEALIILERHAEVVGELSGAVAEEPYDEAMRHALALALYHEQRVDEAAAVCRDGLTLLAQRGIDAPELADLQRTILRRALPVAGRTAPCLLPPRQPRFVGRQAETGEAARVLCDPDLRPATVVVTGPAGIGKTTFAVRVGHQVADEFPDGQLYADLHGAAGERADPPVVLGDFLRALGVRGAAVPAGATDRLQLFRSLLARRRVLVILDDAADPRQVRDLLPNGTGCAAVVTSRTCLAGLDGVRLPLGILGTDQALTLLRGMVGDARMDAEPEPAEAIVRLCDRLPLAVWVAGARLAARPHQALAGLARALADEHRRLDELTVGDVAVRASVELTYRGLAPYARRALRLLGSMRANDFAPWTLAALLEAPLAQAERLLDDLLEVHLLEASRGGRFRLHDLVRLFARERADAEEPPRARAAALRRLLGAALDLAEMADARLSADFLGVAHHRLARWTLPRVQAEWLVADPLAWFDREHGFLVAAVEHGLDAGMTDLAGYLATSLTTFFQVRNHFDEWRRAQSRALTTALAAGDRRTALKLHRNLGELDTIQDRYADAVVHFETALDYGTIDDPAYESAVISGLGYLYRLQGRYDRALIHLTRARELAQAADNLNGMVYAANSIGVVHLECGRLGQAREVFTDCLRLSRLARYRPGEAQALRCLGQVDRAEGDHWAAALAYRQAYEISLGLGDGLVATHAACWLGDVLVRLGEHGEGRRLLARSLWVYREFGNAWGEAAVLTCLADAQLAAGRPALARVRAEQAVTVWRRIGTPHWLATGLDTLAAARRATGDRCGEDLAAAEAATVRNGLAMPSSSRPPGW